MKPAFQHWDEGTFDLAWKRFTRGCDAADRERLERSAGGAELQELERTIAALHLGALSRVSEPPAELLESLVREGRARVGAAGPAFETRRASGRLVRGLALAGWLAAAALLLVILEGGASFAPTGDVTARRLALLEDPLVHDLVLLPWSATDDVAAAGAAGDVAWSSARQEGYLRLRGLEANDPRASQYQLWIFDPTRADWEAKPVDGGVFDVPAGAEVVVPIDPKLRVGRAALFAVTVEVPGGVVVSDRERVVLTAAPEGSG